MPCPASSYTILVSVWVWVFSDQVDGNEKYSHLLHLEDRPRCVLSHTCNLHTHKKRTLTILITIFKLTQPDRMKERILMTEEQPYWQNPNTLPTAENARVPQTSERTKVKRLLQVQGYLASWINKTLRKKHFLTKDFTYPSFFTYSKYPMRISW